MKIGLDAMGGDFAPEAAVKGAILSLSGLSAGTRVILFGDSRQISEILRNEGCPVDSFDIVHTTEVIEMGENPTQTFVKKPDSSIAVGFRHLKEGEISGFASA